LKKNKYTNTTTVTPQFILPNQMPGENSNVTIPDKYFGNVIKVYGEMSFTYYIDTVTNKEVRYGTKLRAK
jgi:hypothetical protein